MTNYDNIGNIIRKRGIYMANSVVTILLVEDDVNECKIYKNIAKNNNKIKFVSITNSSTKALEDVEIYNPDAVILDLELTDGEGSGFDFIEAMKDLPKNRIPKIIVTTNVHSNTVYDYCHSNNIDFVFYKKQKNYSQENIINTLILLKDYKTQTVNSIVELDDNKLEETIINKINKELDLIGAGTHLQGRKYLADAIRFIIQSGDDSKMSIIQHLVAKYKKSSSTISRAMQNAILHAWRITAIEDLTKYYTARVNYETGIPTPTELIYYYADKIKKEI